MVEYAHGGEVVKKAFTVYIVVGVLLALVGIVLARWLLVAPKEVLSPLSDQADLFALLLPEESPDDLYVFTLPEEPVEPAVPAILDTSSVPKVVQLPELPAELSKLFDEPTEEPVVPEPIVLLPVVIPLSPAVLMDEVKTPHAPVVAAPVQEEPSAPATPAAAPASYVYFYTGIPVRHTPVSIVPMNTFVYTSSYTSVTFSHVSVVSPYVVPVFTPPVVPVWVGTPTRVYSVPFLPQKSNGVPYIITNRVSGVLQSP